MNAATSVWNVGHQAFPDIGPRYPRKEGIHREHGSREAAKTAKKAGLLRAFAASRETILLSRRKEPEPARWVCPLIAMVRGYLSQRTLQSADPVTVAPCLAWALNVRT